MATYNFWLRGFLGSLGVVFIPAVWRLVDGASVLSSLIWPAAMFPLSFVVITFVIMPTLDAISVWRRR